MANSSISDRSRPLKGTDGHVLSDDELARQIIKDADKYAKEHNEPAPIDYKFVEWLKDGVKFVQEGNGSWVDYKRRTVQKKFDYSIVVENTNRLNERLEKEGEFDAKVIKQEKGVH